MFHQIIQVFPFASSDCTDGSFYMVPDGHALKIQQHNNPHTHTQHTHTPFLPTIRMAFKVGFVLFIASDF